ncbi:hypothetical protein DO97_02455 [Neosynechococcus sphagnicola sy1]|uniref:FUSC family protein n=1 Tax=Neosynechococcus sphagnicola sy1 TaxID=1497020 RepID=A0A098TKZ7_9CYAN|nr:FUSC family protein [Neosynechococcus sphagnicola]KGF72961.1 hypothetical protein DO97_02455 [Neosynechococcus sphagnicola sy1]
MTRWYQRVQPQVSLTQVQSAIKLGLSAILAFWLAQLCRFEEPVWAVITVGIVNSSYVGNSLEIGRNRIIGTIFGALLGGILSTLLGSATKNPSTLAIGMTAAALLSVWLQLPAYSQKLSTYTLAMVVVAQSHTWAVALNRCLLISLGVVVALGVNLLVWPYPNRDLLRKGLAEHLCLSRHFLATLMEQYLQQQPSATDLAALRTTIHQAQRSNQELIEDILKTPG